MRHIQLDNEVLFPPERLGIKTDDLRAALAGIDEFIDVGETELNAIYKLAAVHAFRRNFGETKAKRSEKE